MMCWGLNVLAEVFTGALLLLHVWLCLYWLDRQWPLQKCFLTSYFSQILILVILGLCFESHLLFLVLVQNLQIHFMLLVAITELIQHLDSLMEIEDFLSIGNKLWLIWFLAELSRMILTAWHWIVHDWTTLIHILHKFWLDYEIGMMGFGVFF